MFGLKKTFEIFFSAFFVCSTHHFFCQLIKIKTKTLSFLSYSFDTREKNQSKINSMWLDVWMNVFIKKSWGNNKQHLNRTFFCVVVQIIIRMCVFIALHCSPLPKPHASVHHFFFCCFIFQIVWQSWVRKAVFVSRFWWIDCTAFFEW